MLTNVLEKLNMSQCLINSIQNSMFLFRDTSTIFTGCLSSDHIKYLRYLKIKRYDQKIYFLNILPRPLGRP